MSKYVRCNMFCFVHFCVIQQPASTECSIVQQAGSMIALMKSILKNARPNPLVISRALAYLIVGYQCVLVASAQVTSQNSMNVNRDIPIAAIIEKQSIDSSASDLRQPPIGSTAYVSDVPAKNFGRGRIAESYFAFTVQAIYAFARSI